MAIVLQVVVDGEVTRSVEVDPHEGVWAGLKKLSMESGASKDAHRVEHAMARRELDDEEAYFVLRFAGHFGYAEAMRRLEGRPWWSRVRKWLVWFGGWETPELLQWDSGEPRWRLWLRVRPAGRRIWRGPWPLSFLGHMLTFNGWGIDLHVRRRGRLVLTWRPGWMFYYSEDGTPEEAVWSLGVRR